MISAVFLNITETEGFYEWSFARTGILNLTKTWKSLTILHVQDIIREEVNVPAIRSELAGIKKVTSEGHVTGL